MARADLRVENAMPDPDAAGPVEAEPVAIAGVRLEARREAAIAVGPQRRGAASVPTAGSR